MADAHIADARRLGLTFPCELTRVRAVARQAHEFLAAKGCHEDDIVDCELALVEACNNAIEYAPESARILPVQVELICDHDFIEMRVIDHTNGFEWPATLVLPGVDSERGRGLYLIRSVMTNAEYIRGEGANVLLLRRHRTS